MTDHCGKILVVDDDADIRETLVEVLSDEGYQALGAADGAEALRVLRSAGPPSLILLDLMMPVMDGRQFRSEQLRDRSLAQVPTVIISAFAELRDEARVLGAQGHMQKPIALSELYRTVSRYCD